MSYSSSHISKWGDIIVNLLDDNTSFTRFSIEELIRDSRKSNQIKTMFDKVVS